MGASEGIRILHLNMQSAQNIARLLPRISGERPKPPTQPTQIIGLNPVPFSTWFADSMWLKSKQLAQNLRFFAVFSGIAMALQCRRGGFSIPKGLWLRALEQTKGRNSVGVEDL
jgi:hypothetical protein